MIRIRRSLVLPIGVDIGHDSVKLLQLEVVDGSLSVVAASRHVLPDEARQEFSLRTAAAMEVVRRALRSGHFAGKRVIAAVPREIVHVKNLRLPHMPIAELAAAVEFEARNVFPFDTDQAHVRFLHAGEVRQGSDAREEAIVLAARRDEVDGFVEQLHRSGAKIESLDFEPAAIYRSVERFIRRREDENEVNVLVDVGARHTQVIIGRGRDISFFKPVETGGQHLNEAVSRKLGITLEEARELRRRLIESAATAASDGNSRRDPVRQAVYDSTRSVIEELAREISLCLRYYSVTFRGQRPSRVRLVGGEACDPHLQAILGANLPVPVETLRPLANLNTSRIKQGERRGYLAEWTVALGLSLKLTQQRFGARNDKRSDTGESPQGPRATAFGTAAAAEVVDLTRAVAASGAAPLATVMREAHHA